MTIIYIISITLFVYMVWRRFTSFSAENWNGLAGGIFYLKTVGDEDLCSRCKSNSIRLETTELEDLGAIGRSKTEKVCQMCGNRKDYSFNTWTKVNYTITLDDKS